MQLVQASTHFEEKGEQTTYPIALVIEDHPATRYMLSCMLGLHGYQPVCASNGREALEWIEIALHTEQYPAVILLDLFMPEMDGANFLTHLHARWQAPVPLPSTIVLTVDRTSHKDLACTDFLQKPFRMKELVEKLRLVTGDTKYV